MIITILAYRESGSTYCRGCGIPTGTDFEHQVFDPDLCGGQAEAEKEASEFILRFLVYNDDPENGGDYDITIFVDGMEANYYTDEPDPNDTVACAGKRVRDGAKLLRHNQKVAAEVSAMERAAREAEAKAAWVVEQARLKEVAEREEYESLKAKFEGGKDATEAKVEG